MEWLDNIRRDSPNPFPLPPTWKPDVSVFDSSLALSELIQLTKQAEKWIQKEVGNIILIWLCQLL